MGSTKVINSDLPNAILDELTAHFIASRFDMRELIRVITNTRAYQATSKSQGKVSDEDLFRRNLRHPFSNRGFQRERVIYRKRLRLAGQEHLNERWSAIGIDSEVRQRLIDVAVPRREPSSIRRARQDRVD